MPADGSPPGLPAPTLFISYASQDREAARLLRDALIAQGIDVWYDEDDLTGGDAWDQKIRRRIRECDFFMPVISQATQARSEGYFRREWRQAAERTLDMADDVMFLLPVNISDITEAGARVPERFHHVHWTRCPGGISNSDLEDLCRQMLGGAAAPTSPAPSPVSKPKRPTAHTTTPSPLPSPKNGKGELPPYPDQPQRTADEPAWLHVFNLLVWVVRCAYRAYRGFPRILRWIVIIWVIYFLFSGDEPSPSSPRLADDSNPTTAAEIIDVVAGEGTEVSGFGQFLGAVADIAQAGRTLALVPFSTEGDPERQEFADQVFQEILGQLSTDHRDEISYSPMPLGIAPGNLRLTNRLGRTESTVLLTGWISETELVVILQEAGKSAPTSELRFNINDQSPSAISEAVAQEIDAIEVFGPTTGIQP